jgi:hypothetical protein
MKLSLIAAALVIAGSAIVIGQSMPAAGERVTVAGCLQRAQRNGSAGGTVVGTSASPSTADDEANSGAMVDAFLLAEAAPVTGVGATDRTATTARSGDTTAPNAAGTSGRAELTTFGLQGREAELEQHQGARVEVTGTIVPPAMSGRGSGGAATAAGAKRVKVESFKVLAEQCHSR